MITHKISKQTKTDVTLHISVDAQFIDPYQKSVLKRLKKDLKVDGFRPGNVPDKIAERELGAERVQAEVLEEVVMHAYTRAARELKLDTIASPNISLKKFVPYTELEFEAEVAIMPEVKIDLTKLSVKKAKVKVDPKEITETLDNLRKQSATKIASKSGIKNGDEVKFDFDGTRAGKPVDGASSKGHVLTIGEGSFIPGFEDNMIGLKNGETKTFTVTFPKDYHAKDLASADVEFTVTIHEINTSEIPKLNDSWAKTVGPVQDLKALKVEIAKSLEHNKQAEIDKQFENQVLEAALKLAKFDAPSSLVEEQITRLRSETEENLRNSGLDIEKYLQLQGQKPEEFEATLKTEAEKRVKIGLLLRQIIESEKVTVSDAEVETELAQMKANYTDPKMQEELTHGHFKDDLRNHLLTTKAVAILSAAATK